MKKFNPLFKLTLLSLALFLMPLMAFGDVTEDQLSFSQVYGEDETTVIGYSIARNPEVLATALVGELIIPENHEGKPVMAISDGAFMKCSGITSVVFPATIKSIGAYSFKWCEGITSMVVPTTVENIGEQAFAASGITNITLPENLTEIADELLSNTPLTSINIPVTATRIGDLAFYGTNLSSVVIPPSVETIGAGAFHRCYSLESVTFNSGLKRIENGNWKGAFMDCTSLKELILPETLEYIGDMAFVGCSNLETILLPESINDYGSNVFAQCSGLKKVISLKNYGVSTYYNLFSTSAEKFVQSGSYMNIYNSCVLNFPFGGSYYSAPWRFFANRLEGIGNHVLQSAEYSKEEGSYEEAFSLTLSNPNGRGILYYMLVPQNGNSVGPVEYEGPIEISTSSTVRTWIRDGDDCSDVAQASYEISAVTIEVAGIAVDSKNCWDVLGDKGSVTFDSKSGSLILRNANINTMNYKSDCGIRAFGDDLTIEVNGDNTITTSDLGIEYGYAYGKGIGGNLTIRGGDSKEGTSSLTFNFEGKWSMGAIFLYLANLTVETCNIYIKNFNAGIEFKAAPKNGGMLMIDNSTLDISTTDTAIEGVYDLCLGKGIVIKVPFNGEFVSAYEGDEKEGLKGGICVGGILQKRVVIGPEVPPIPQITENKTVNFGETLNEDTDLTDTTIDDVHYNLDDENGNGYDATDQCVVISTVMTAEVMEEVPTNVVENAYFPTSYQGMVVVVGGEGTIEVNCQTSTTTCVAVKVGDSDPTVINNPSKTTAAFSYDTGGPVYAYIYAVEAPTSTEPESVSARLKSMKAPASDNAVKIYSLKVNPTNVMTGIEDITADKESTEEIIYDIQGRRCKEPLAPGFYIINGKKIIR